MHLAGTIEGYVLYLQSRKFIKDIAEKSTSSTTNYKESSPYLVFMMFIQNL